MCPLSASPPEIPSYRIENALIKIHWECLHSYMNFLIHALACPTRPRGFASRFLKPYRFDAVPRLSHLITQQSTRPLLFFLRKEVIQPHLPIRLPCYDFTPVISPTFGSSLLAVGSLTSGVTNSHGVTGGVYKTRERIHRDILIRDY